ncbi:MAG: hypothetical protein ACYSW1_20015, partial [Planctomycetota bacterium]
HMSKGRRLIAVLLTVNAVLLSALLWVQLAETPILARPALAQRQQLPNAGMQRERMLASLEAIRRSVDETRTILKTGRVKVVPVAPSSTGDAKSPRK